MGSFLWVLGIIFIVGSVGTALAGGDGGVALSFGGVGLLFCGFGKGIQREDAKEKKLQERRRVEREGSPAEIIAQARAQLATDSKGQPLYICKECGTSVEGQKGVNLWVTVALVAMGVIPALLYLMVKGMKDETVAPKKCNACGAKNSMVSLLSPLGQKIAASWKKTAD